MKAKQFLTFRVALWWLLLLGMGGCSIRLLVWVFQKVTGHATPADNKSALLCLGGYFVAAAAWVFVTGPKRGRDG